MAVRVHVASLVLLLLLGYGILGQKHDFIEETTVLLVPTAVPSTYGIVSEFNKFSMAGINAYIFEYRKGARIPGDELLLSDTKSWRFPKQDISLAINYPGSRVANESFYVTQFRVFVSQDTSHSLGYMTSGGPGHPHLELTFVATEAMYFTYDMRLYGIYADLIENPDDIFTMLRSIPGELSL